MKKHIIHQEDEIKLINENMLINNIQSQTTNISKTLLFFNVYHNSVYKKIRQLQLISYDLETIICDYLNEHYTIEYRIIKNNDAMYMSLISHDELQFSFDITEKTNYCCLKMVEKSTNNILRASHNMNLEHFFNYYMCYYHKIENYISTNKIPYFNNISDTYNFYSLVIFVLDNAKLTRTIELLRIILKIIKKYYVPIDTIIH